MKCGYKAFSECGPRWQNEDTLAVVEMQEQGRTMFILCDGMGGHRHGDVASNVIVEAFCNYWRDNIEQEDSENKIRNAAEFAFATLNNCPHYGMGTTMVMAAVEKGKLFVAHCGDSRFYIRQHDKSEVYRTNDHIEVTPEGWEYVAKGFTQETEGYMPEIECIRLNVGDVFMLCSDGVYNAFKKDELEMLLTTEENLDVLTYKIKTLCDVNSRDNYSAIVVRVIE